MIIIALAFTECLEMSGCKCSKCLGHTNPFSTHAYSTESLPLGMVTERKNIA